MNPGDGSMDGWSWSLQGRVTNTETITQQINYASVNRGLSYESEGTNRNVPVNFATVAERDAAAGVAGTTNYSDRVGEPARRHREPADRHRQPRVHRRAVRHPGRLHLQRGAAGRRDRAQLRLPGEQHRQHRHEGRAGVRSVRRRHRAGRAARSGAGAADRRLLPRLRPELSGPVALQRVEARVRPVRRQRQPAEPVAGAHQPRPHGQLRHRARRREHAGDAAGRLRPRGRPPGRGRGAQPLRRRHADHRHRRRRAGRPRPRRFASRHGATSSGRT